MTFAEVWPSIRCNARTFTPALTANLVDPATEVDLKTGMAAACRLQEVIDSHGDQADWARAQADMGRIVEVVRTFIPSEKWPDVQAALRSDVPIGDSGAEESGGVEMVEIDDGFDGDGY